MKKILICSSIIFVLMFQFLSTQDIMNLNIELYKDTYLIWEPIFIKVNLVNNSEDTIKYVLHGDFEYEIKDSKGREYEYDAIHGFKGVVVIGGTPLYQTLLPSQSLTLLGYHDILYSCGDLPDVKKGHEWWGPSIGIRKFLP